MFSFFRYPTIKLLFLVYCIWFYSSCSSDSKKNNLSKKGLFALYLEETFNSHIKTDSAYFLIIGKQICTYCEKGTIEGFKIQQTKIKSSEIMLITDFRKEDIDTLLIDTFKPKILLDSLGNFGNYTFPRSYITIYKIIDGKIKKFAYLSDDKALNSFLKQENLIRN